MSVTENFKNAFDSSNEVHVKWLASFFKYAKNLASSREPIDKFIQKNPFGIKLSDKELQEWIHIHFILSMKYSQDVLDRKAWIPPASL
jgi:hypothetical protein